MNIETNRIIQGLNIHETGEMTLILDFLYKPFLVFMYLLTVSVMLAAISQLTFNPDADTFVFYLNCWIDNNETCFIDPLGDEA